MFDRSSVNCSPSAVVPVTVQSTLSEPPRIWSNAASCSPRIAIGPKKEKIENPWISCLMKSVSPL